MLRELEAERSTVIGDLEAGVGTLLRLQPGQADLVIVVAQPTAKAIEVARRAVEIASTRARVLVIANRVRDDADVRLIRDGVGPFDGELVVVPDDASVARADEEGAAPVDAAPDGPAVRALEQLARGIRED